MSNIAEIKRRADIREVWAALGGGTMRGRRGQAFWRNGNGFNVALDADRGVWYDHVAGEGGDVIALVRTVRQCGFLEAAEWLAQHTGVRVSEWIRREGESDTDWPTDLRWATWWRVTAEALAEDELARLPYDGYARRDLTMLLRRIRLGDSTLVEEYRHWRRRDPQLTAAMTHAGRRGDARAQRRLAQWIFQRG